MPGRPQFPGFRLVYAHDPFGNRLKFLQSSTLEAALALDGRLDTTRL